jgi:protein-tyrosine phosphatase
MLCTANVCRSPLAAALLTRRLRVLDVALPVTSAGLTGGGQPALPGMVAVAAGYGVDISSHRSHAVTISDLTGARLVLGMSREHLRHAVVTVPPVWPRAFTLKELVRRGERIGPRAGAEPLAEWLSRAHAGRDRASLLGPAPDDDVPDPAGGPPQAYADAVALLGRLIARLCELCWAHGEPG